MRAGLALLALLAACDPPARSQTGGPPPPARVGRELESCASTRDCAEPLRCVEATCVPAERSRLGEYLWASARRSAEHGQAAAAIATYQQAAAQFDADRQPQPAGLLCDFGALLVQQAGDARAGEQAARLLHRCLLATPPGSRLHDGSLHALAELEPRGLDPTQLARDAPADTYIVNKPAAPTAEALRVEIARSTPASDKGYEAFVRLLESDAARPALARCFGEQWSRTFAPRLAVTLPVKLKIRLNEDDEPVGAAMELLPDPAAADDAGSKCLRAALQPLVSEKMKTGSSGSWQGAVTVTLTAP